MFRFCSYYNPSGSIISSGSSSSSSNYTSSMSTPMYTYIMNADKTIASNISVKTGPVNSSETRSLSKAYRLNLQSGYTCYINIPNNQSNIDGFPDKTIDIVLPSIQSFGSSVNPFHVLKLYVNAPNGFMIRLYTNETSTDIFEDNMDVTNPKRYDIEISQSNSFNFHGIIDIFHPGSSSGSNAYLVVRQ